MLFLCIVLNLIQAVCYLMWLKQRYHSRKQLVYGSQNILNRTSNEIKQKKMHREFLSTSKMFQRAKCWPKMSMPINNCRNDDWNITSHVMLSTMDCSITSKFYSTYIASPFNKKSRCFHSSRSHANWSFQLAIASRLQAVQRTTYNVQRATYINNVLTSAAITSAAPHCRSR
jgi:hypothetical protein